MFNYEFFMIGLLSVVWMGSAIFLLYKEVKKYK